MNLCIKIPAKLRFKRYSKKYAKLKYLVNHSPKITTVHDSPQFICGLKALTHGFLSAKLLNTCVLLLRRSVGKGRVGWPRVRIVFNLKVPVTKKSEGHRMGKGKGPVRSWGVSICAGSFVFKIHKSPRKMFFIRTFDWTNIFSFYEWLDTTNAVYASQFFFRRCTAVLIWSGLQFLTRLLGLVCFCLEFVVKVLSMCGIFLSVWAFCCICVASSLM